MCKRLLAVLYAAIFLFLPALCGLLLIDHLVTPRQSERTAEAAFPPGASATTEDVPRIFVLFIDSLRAATALDPEIMPTLASLRPESTYATVETVYDAVTVPAVRAAFTGNANFRVFAFVQNFLTRVNSVPSLFTQVKAAGGSAIAYSDAKTFAQFHDDLRDIRMLVSDEVESQNAQAREAFGEFKRGSDRLVVMHIGYADYVAHKYGVFAPEYKERFGIVDRLIGEFAPQLAPNESLVVFGDHGHTETGRHALGLDVPTYIQLYGAPYAKGENLGHIPITRYRALLSQGLGLPVRQDVGEAPKDLRAYWWHLAGASLGIALGFTIWWQIRKRLWKGVQWSLLAGRFKARFGLAAIAALVFFLWGDVLAQVRVFVHEPQYPLMYNLWGLALLGGLLLRKWLPANQVAWILAVPPLFLLYPTVYRYGFAGAVGPMWFCWWALIFLPALKDKVTRRQVLAPALLLVWLVQIYFFVDASNFEFTRFVALCPEVRPQAPGALTITTFLVSAALLLDGQGNIWRVPLALFLALYVVAVNSQIFPADGVENGLIAVSILVAAGLAARWPEVRAAALPLAVVGLMAATFYLLRLSPEKRLHLMIVFAAVRLSHVLVLQTTTDQSQIRSHRQLLLLFAALLSGWLTIGWSMHALEWHVLYKFFPPKLVEDHVALFLPVIVLRYALPVVIARLVLRFDGGYGPALAAGERHGLLLVVAGCKFASLAAVALGLALTNPNSNVYLEAVQQLAIWATLSLGFF